MLGALMCVVALQLAPQTVDSGQSAPKQQGAAASIVRTARLDSGEPVIVRAHVIPDTVYVGEQATYEVGVFIDQAVRSRLRRNPGFTPPELRGTVVYDLPAARGSLPVRREGPRAFEAHVYQRALFPLTPGTFVVPSAELRYALPVSVSFFSREENYVLRTDSLAFVVRSLPDRGKPADFTGAVGDLTVEAVLDTARARVGDPLLLTVRVSGRGNVRMLPRPMVRLSWGALIAASDRVSVDTATAVVRGWKEFAWVVTPHLSGDRELGAIRYPYFDPSRATYALATTAPIRVRVLPGTLVSQVAAPDGVAPLALRRRYRGAQETPLHERPVFWALLALAPAPAIATGLARRPRRRRRVSDAARLRDIARDPTIVDPAVVRRALVAALAERLHLGAGVLSSRSSFERTLRRSGVSAETAARAESFLAELDRVAYGGGGPTELLHAGRDAYLLYRTVSGEARNKRALAARDITSLAFTFVAVVGLVTAQSQTTAAALFARGIDEYGERRFAESAQLFRATVRLDPRAPDAWANFGTASAMQGDTANAIAGWQRALRLEPVASDVRTRLLALRPTAARELAWVPPVPTAWLIWGAALLWITVCAAALVVVRHRGRRRRRGWIGGATALVGAAVFGVAATLTDARLAARDLVVVATTEDMRELPALSADPSGRLSTGDVARVRRTQGSWVFVELDGGRAGWISVDHLISIARD